MAPSRLASASVSGRLTPRMRPRKPARPSQQGAERKHEPFDQREIRCPPSGPTEYEQLLLHEQIFCHQSAHSARPGQLGQDRHEVNQQQQETIHHGRE